MEGRRKALWELVLLVLLLGTGLFLRRRELVLLAIPLAVHLVAGLALAPPQWRPRLEVTRVLSATRLVEGEELEVSLTVENWGRLLELVSVVDPVPRGWQLLEGEPKAVRRLQPGEGFTLSYRVRPRRGLYRLERVRLEVRDLLGFTVWQGELPCPAELAVLPLGERLRGLTIRPPRTLVAAGTAPARTGGGGVEFFGTREYLPGDEVRRINWKALARRDRLAVNLYQEERAAEVMLVLDVRASAYGEERLLDYGVRAAASLVHFLLQEGHRVGLLLYGRHLAWELPGLGRRHRERLLRLLAQARLGTSAVFTQLTYLPTRFFPAGSQIVLVSPLLPGDEEWIGRAHARGYAVLVIVPDPGSFYRLTVLPRPEVDLAARLLSLERRVMLRRLLRAGVRVVEWDVRAPLAPRLAAAATRWR